MSNEKEIPYKVIMHKFVGMSGSGGYTYELTFNQSMVHTGRWKGIEDGLNAYRENEKKKYEEDILKEASEIQKERNK